MTNFQRIKRQVTDLRQACIAEAKRDSACVRSRGVFLGGHYKPTGDYPEELSGEYTQIHPVTRENILATIRQIVGKQDLDPADWAFQLHGAVDAADSVHDWRWGDYYPMVCGWETDYFDHELRPTEPALHGLGGES